EENADDAQIAALLTALRMKGETADEMAGMVEVIRAQSELDDLYIPNIMDNCGTGGDQSNSFNISTTTAFVLAGAGVTVAKHGNSSISSKTGSADVLEELGVSITMTKEHTEAMLKENKINFLFAPNVNKKLHLIIKVITKLGLPNILLL